MESAFKYYFSNKNYGSFGLIVYNFVFALQMWCSIWSLLNYHLYFWLCPFFVLQEVKFWLSIFSFPFKFFLIDGKFINYCVNFLHKCMVFFFSLLTNAWSDLVLLELVSFNQNLRQFLKPGMQFQWSDLVLGYLIILLSLRSGNWEKGRQFLSGCR